MWNYLFEIIGDSDYEGEQFFVQCDTKDEAWDIASENFFGEELKYLGRYDDYYAEMMGYDTY